MNVKQDIFNVLLNERNDEFVFGCPNMEEGNLTNIIDHVDVDKIPIPKPDILWELLQ